MPKKQSFQVAALNLRLEDHRSSEYEQLMVNMYRLKRKVRLRRDSAAMISSIDTKRRRGVVFGNIAKFSRIDPDADWFDERTLNAAKETEKDEIEIPDYLYPNLRVFSFAFDVKRHTLIFEKYHAGQSISPRIVKKIFAEISSDTQIADRFGSVEVSIISSAEGVEHVFSLARVRKATIFIARPNPIDIGDDADFMQRLNEQNGRDFLEVWRAAPGKSFKPDEQTRSLANIASRNGYVETEGRNAENVFATASTEDHPAISSIKYDRSDTTEFSAFGRAMEVFTREHND